jgi:charged multivesicular body protein 1
MTLNCVQEHLFNLKFAAKDLERNAKKCEKSEKEEKNKCKKVNMKLTSLCIDKYI